MRNHPYLASRVFNTPLMIQDKKLESILYALGKKLHLAQLPVVEAAAIPSERKERKPYYVTDNGIAVISVIGPLVKRSSGNFMSGGPTTYGEITAEFNDAIADPEIKGIVMEFDSPGGEVGGVYELGDRIYANRGTKPIYAVADDDAFSAAYLLASSAEKLYVTSVGGVGSIGVYMVHVDQSKYDKKLGVQYNYIYAGAKKVELNPHEAITSTAKDSMQAEVDRLYGSFVDYVARNRGADAAAIRATEAGLLFGDAGVPLLADQVGTMETAIADMTKQLDTGGAVGKSMSAAAAETAVYAKVPNTVAEISTVDESTTTIVTSVFEPQPSTQTDDILTNDQDAQAVSAAQTNKGDKNMSEENTAADSVEAPPKDGNVEDKVSAALEQGRGDALAIANVCKAAGMDGYVGEFLEQNLTLAQVCAKLVELRAEKAESVATAVESHVSAISTNAAEKLSGAVAKIADRDGVSKYQATLKALENDPKLYDEYAAQNPRQFAPVVQQ